MVPEDAAIAADAATPLSRASHPDALPKLEVQEVEETGLWPKAAILSHDDKTLVVLNFGQLDKTKNITLYDADSLHAIGRIDIPHVVVEGALSRDDKTLFASSFWGHSVIFVDLTTKTVTHEVKTGNHPKTVVVTPDGRYVFAANWSGESVTQIDVESKTALRTLRVGKNPRGLAVTSTNVLYAANFYDESIDVFEGPELERRHRIKVCRCPRHLALSPDEKTLYISCLFRSEIHALDLATETVTHRATVGSAPKTIAVSPDGRYVYSADYGTTRSLSVVDTQTWTASTFAVPGMDRGCGLAVAADGEHAFVTGWYDAHVYRVGFEGTGGHPDLAARSIERWRHRAFSKDPGDAH